MSNCKTEADLHDEYARVLRMCSGTGVRPGDCWKLDGARQLCRPAFASAPSSYTFALAIVYDDVRKEDRPVFEGDVLYDTAGGKWLARNGHQWNYEHGLSWNPPKKKTFPLNGEELPSPDMAPRLSGYRIAISHLHSWSNLQDAEKVQTAINKLLSGG